MRNDKTGSLAKGHRQQDLPVAVQRPAAVVVLPDRGQGLATHNDRAS